MEKKPVKNLLDKITPEDLEKIREHQASTEGAHPVDNEWMLAAEFAKAFGWDAYMAIENDEIDTPTMLTLIEANRKLESIQQYRDSQSSLIGAVSANSKKPSTVFTKLTKNILKHAKVRQ